LADVHVPDGSDPTVALARTTDLGIGAHPDDLEFFAVGPIGACREDPDRWFSGVTCTDGGGSVSPEAGASLAATRAAEQRAAADIGGYSVVIQLGYASAPIQQPEGFAALVDDLVDLLDRCVPHNVYTHNLADKHATHVAVGAAVVAAVRRLEPGRRPSRLVGCEAWRDLDWLPDGEKVRIDVSAHGELASSLADVFASQLAAKRYGVAARGRRQANATLFDARAADTESEVIVAMDLSPLVFNDEIDPTSYVLSAIDRFRDEVAANLRRHFTSLDAGAE
jgi:LmbE family N-acetylglucosaminyl deacetylase